MKCYQAELLLDAKCALAECPIYDEEKDGLYWLDIEQNRIFFLDFATKQCLYTQMDRKIGSIVLTDQGRLLAGMDDGVYLIDGLSCRPYCMIPESYGDSIRFNDGKCDPQGRFIVLRQRQGSLSDAVSGPWLFQRTGVDRGWQDHVPCGYPGADTKLYL